MHYPDSEVPRNFARIYGITGFIFELGDYPFQLETRWDGFYFEFDFKNAYKQLKYFSYQYLFFTGS